MGIGGWVSTKHSLAWFAEAYTMEEIRAFWPFLTKDAQKYIACFETLAQLALAMTAQAHHGHSRLSLCLPTESDNTPTEGGVNKLFTTSWPLSQFLSLVASWSNGLTIQVSHVAGAHNEWADDLSRGRLHAFAHRSQDRFRVPLELASASAKASWSLKGPKRSLTTATAASQRTLRPKRTPLRALLPREVASEWHSATLRTEHRPRWGSPTCAYFDRCFCPKGGVTFCLGPSLGA